MENPTQTKIIAETALAVFRASTIHGTGGFARVAIARGQRILQYVGERISKSESLRRCEGEDEFIFALNDQEDLDGNVPWNSARFLNHSCSPNCDAEVESGEIWVVANRDIGAGEELTFNYGFDLENYKGYPCHCGAADCVGYIVAEEFFEHVRRQREIEKSST